MKQSTRLIHSFIRILNLEPVIHRLTKMESWFIKFMPTPQSYDKSDHIRIRRNHINFLINRSDYMQWHIYANLPDFSWKSASEIVKEGETILDIGANCGAFSLNLAAQTVENKISQVKIHAIEPNPSILNALDQNRTANPSLASTIQIHPIALGNENGTISIEFDPENSGAGRVVHAKNSTVPIYTLDSYVKANGLSNITFIKIDVEGYEPKVLAGAVETIIRFKPAIFIEMTDDWFRSHNSSCNEIIDKFIEWGYEFSVETPNGMIKISNLKLEMKNIYQYNLLCTIHGHR